MSTHTRLWRQEAELKAPEVPIPTMAEDEALEVFRLGEPDLMYIQVRIKDHDEQFNNGGLGEPFYNLSGALCQCIEIDHHGMGVVPSPVPDRCRVLLDDVAVQMRVLIR